MGAERCIRDRYLIREGHGHADLGDAAISVDSFQLHFARSPNSRKVDYWVLVQTPSPRIARTMFYLLWERNIPTTDMRT